MRPGGPRWRRALALVALLLLVVVAGGFYWDAQGRVATVEAGRLYRSKAMAPQRLVEVSRRLGIRTVIDLRKGGPDVDREASVLAEAGIRHVSLPSTQVPDLDTVDRFLDLMATADGPVLVHCRHGVGRSGVFSAIYRIEHHGWSRTRARLEALLLAGGGSFGPGSEKAAFLAGYRRRAERAAAPRLPANASDRAILASP